MKFNAVIFDLDGTLIDSLEDLADSMNAALHGAGLPGHDKEEYKVMIGNGVSTLAKRAARSEDPSVYEPVLANMRRIYPERAFQKTYIYSGIGELLASLRAASIEIAVLTNKDQVFASNIVDHYFGPASFDAVWGAMPGRAVKPDPSALLELIALLGTEPAKTVFVGDSGLDMQTARAAGTAAAGVSWGFRTKHELENHGAQIILNRPSDLLKFMA